MSGRTVSEQFYRATGGEKYEIEIGMGLFSIMKGVFNSHDNLLASQLFGLVSEIPYS